MKMLCGSLSTCARTSFICFIFVSLRRGSTTAEIMYQLLWEPAVPAYLDAGGRHLDPDHPELGRRRHEIVEEGTLVRRALVDRAARPHVELEHLVEAHQEGVEEAGVHGP